MSYSSSANNKYNRSSDWRSNSSSSGYRTNSSNDRYNNSYNRSNDRYNSSRNDSLNSRYNSNYSSSNSRYNNRSTSFRSSNSNYDSKYNDYPTNFRRSDNAQHIPRSSYNKNMSRQSNDNKFVTKRSITRPVATNKQHTRSNDRVLNKLYNKSNKSLSIYDIGIERADLNSVEEDKETILNREEKYAYVWLIMKGDAYLPGVFVSMYSVKRTNPNADLVVMVTDDVTSEARERLEFVADHIYDVPYLSYKMTDMLTKKQNESYGSWMHVSCTKWNVLSLPYDKVLFLDADTIVTSNIDHLFDLPTPAAPFNNPFTKPFGWLPTYLKGNKGDDGYLQHGERVMPKVVDTMLHRKGTLLTASCVLLSPSQDDFKNYKKMMNSYKVYGKHTKCYSGFDEQSIAEFYSIQKKATWYNIHHRYNYIGWKRGFLCYDDVPFVIHYISPNKPWDMKWNEWEDVISWYKMADEALSTHELLPEDIYLIDENISLARSNPDTYVKEFTGDTRINSILDLQKHKIDLYYYPTYQYFYKSKQRRQLKK